MFTIIRIEHEDGYGPWRNKGNRFGLYTAWLDVEHPLYPLALRHETNLNSPDEDGINIERDDFCAFKNLEDFNKLYTLEDVQFLLKEDFKVLMLDVSEMKEGEQQVCYKKTNILETKDISSLFN